MSGREGGNQKTVQMAIYSALAKPKRDSMGTAFSSGSCRFFQIAYLPLKPCQKGFAWDPDPSASISLLMQSRAITIPAQIAELIASPSWGFSGLDSAPQAYYVHAVLLSAVAETLKIGIKSYRATETGNRIAQMTHRQVIPALITLISSLKGGLRLNISLKASFSFYLEQLVLLLKKKQAVPEQDWKK